MSYFEIRKNSYHNVLSLSNFYLRIFLFFMMIFFSSEGRLYGLSLTAVMLERGYKSVLNFEKEAITYTKSNLNVVFTEYSPLVRIGDSIYFLKEAPRLGITGITLEEEDFLQFLRWLRFHEDKRKLIIEKKSNNLIISTPQNKNKEIRLHKIILDAGHGGSDPGASAYGFLEKDLALMITKDLGEALQKEGTRAKVILIRKKDVYISLEKRCHLANSMLEKSENGLFISIHLNRWFHASTRGFEAYYLAHRSNIMDARIHSHVEDSHFDLMKTNWKKLDPFRVLFSRLEMVQYQKESKAIANNIRVSFQKHSLDLLPIRGVKSDLFYVLKGVLMPAVLVEVGFISNRKDLELITDKKKRKQLTQAIAKGILKYERDFNRSKGFSSQLFLSE